MVQKRFTALFKSYPRFIQKDKNADMVQKRFSALFKSIRVLSKRIKRGYGPKNFFSPFSYLYACIKNIEYCPRI
jgi:hypothetical protein